MTLGPPCLWYRTAFAMKRSLRKKRQHTGVTIQPVMGNLSVAEESYQWNIAQRAAHHPQFRTAGAEQVLAARHARVVQGAARGIGLQFPENAFQVGARRRGIAPQEEDLHARLD